MEALRSKLLQILHRDGAPPPDVGEVLAGLEADGIGSLAAFVERTIDELRRHDLPRPDFLDPDALVAASTVQPRRHGVPGVPFRLEGVEYDPADVCRFDGQQLHFVLVPRGASDAVLLAYRDRMNPFATYLRMRHHLRAGALWEGHARNGGWGPPPGTPPNNPYPPAPGFGCGFMGLQPCVPPYVPPRQVYPTQVQMFDDPDFRGNWFWLEAGFEWRNLGKVPRHRSSNWNDEIESLAAVDATVQYFEHAETQGSSVTVPPLRAVNNVASLGFFGRISSVTNHG